MKGHSWKQSFGKIKKSELINIEKQNKDYCIINGNKIEGNACSTIIDNKKMKSKNLLWIKAFLRENLIGERGVYYAK